MPNLLHKYFATIKKFLPDDQMGSAVGLDIGASECKLVELVKNGKKIELISWAVEPIHNGDIKLAVQKILRVVSFPCKTLYTSVFGKGTLIRYIDMPRMSLDDLKSSFDIESDKYFPFAQDQIYTDCFILNANEGGKNMSVMAAASKRELVDRRMKLLNELGMTVEFIGLNPIILVNTLNVLAFGDEDSDKSKEKETAVAFLDMGESVSSLTILVDRLPRFTRDIFIGGRDFTKSISNAMGMDFQDAEKLKSQPGERLEEFLRACDTVVMNMIQELRLSIDYFATEKNCEISRLMLTGGGSMLEGVAELFEKHLEVSVSQWNPLSKLEISSEVSSEEIEKKSMKLGVAIGLALYQL